MRRLLPLFVLCGALAVSGGCAASAGTGTPNWVQPVAANGSTTPSDPSGSTDPNAGSGPSAAPSSAAPAPPKATPTKQNPPPPPAGSGPVQQLLAQVNQLRA